MTVTVAKVTGGDAGLTFDTDPNTPGVQNTLTFNSTNWNTPQTVTVYDANDADTINGTATLTLTPNAASGYAPRPFALTEIDKDLNSIMLSAEQLQVAEGKSNTFTVALSSAPTSFVEVDIVKRDDSSSDMLADNSAAVTRIEFSPLNWNTPQTVTLNAPLDTTVNNGTAYFYVYAPNNPEYAFQTVTANEIGVGQFTIAGNAQAVGHPIYLDGQGAHFRHRRHKHLHSRPHQPANLERYRKHRKAGRRRRRLERFTPRHPNAHIHSQ